MFLSNILYNCGAEQENVYQEQDVETFSEFV